ncbi:MAG: hypothetical protein RL291_375 [Pseudomonadota bacterium]
MQNSVDSAAKPSAPERSLSAWSSPAVKIVIAATAAIALVGALLSVVIGREANRALTERTLALIEADLRTARAVYRAGGLPALIESVGDPDTRAHHLILDREGKSHGGALPFTKSDAADLAKGAMVRTHVGRVVTLNDEVSLIVARDVSSQIALIDRLRNWLTASLAALGLIAGGAAVMVHRFAMRRVARVTAATQSILAGDLSARIPQDHSADDFDTLVGNVNVMLGRIEELMATVRDVSDNIAHDLRTPLNRLRNNAEEALRQPQGSPVHARALERVISEADDIIRTFNALLEIARLESGTHAPNFQTFDLSATVTDMAELYLPVAEDRDLDFVTSVEEGLLAHGNRQMIGQVLSNLIDNAMKYGRWTEPREGPAIAMTVDADDGNIVILVADRGPGIKPEDQAKALKRFGRLEESRSAPGTGLGLSLVTAIVRLHKGTLTLEDNEPGLRVRITLPLAGRKRPSPTRSYVAKEAAKALR